jgi:MFS family permease
LSRPEYVVRHAAVALWNRSFVCLTVGSLVSRLGTAIFDVVLAWWLVQETGSALPVGYVLAAATIPTILLGPIGGVLVDRWNKKYVLVAADLVAAGAAAAVAAMAYLDAVRLPLLVASAFVLGASTAVFKPALRALVPALVDKRHLVRANSVSTGITESTKVVGPVIGGWLLAIAVLGVPGAFALNAVSYLASAAAGLAVDYRHRRTGPPPGGVAAQLRAGIGYVNRLPVLRRLLVLCGVVNFFLVSGTVLLPVYVRDSLHGSGRLYSLVLTAEAVGGIAAAVAFLVAPTSRRQTGRLGWFLLLSGVCLGLFPLPGSGAGLALLAFGQGLFMSAFNTLFFTYVQDVTDPDFLGRVLSIVYVVAMAVMPLSYLTFGYLGDRVVESAFLVAGAGTVLCAVPFLGVVRSGSWASRPSARVRQTAAPTFAKRWPASASTVAAAAVRPPAACTSPSPSSNRARTSWSPAVRAR